MLTGQLTFWGIARLSSKAAALPYMFSSAQFVAPPSPDLCRHSLLYGLSQPIPLDAKRYLFVLLISISLMMNEWCWHIFMYFLTICTSFSEKCLFNLLSIFQYWVICLFIVELQEFSFLNIFYVCKVLLRYIICKHLLPFCGLSFYVLMLCFEAQTF